MGVKMTPHTTDVNELIACLKNFQYSTPVEQDIILLRTTRILTEFVELEQECRRDQLVFSGIKEIVHTINGSMGQMLNMLVQFEEQEKESLAANSNIQDLINALFHDTQHALTITNSYLKDLPPYQFHAVNLASAIHKAINESPLPESIILTLNLADELPDVLVDPSLTVKVFMHLISNSVEAMNGQGTLIIGTSLHNDQVQTWVSDSGSGMSQHF